MDLLAQYSDASGEAGAGDGDTDDDVATTAAMLRAKHAVPDLAPRVNDAGLAVAGEGADARLVSLASTRDMHGTRAPRTAPTHPRAPDRHAPDPAQSSREPYAPNRDSIDPNPPFHPATSRSRVPTPHTRTQRT